MLPNFKEKSPCCDAEIWDPDCPACEGDDQDCPQCQGQGFVEGWGTCSECDDGFELQQ